MEYHLGHSLTELNLYDSNDSSYYGCKICNIIFYFNSYSNRYFISNHKNINNCENILYKHGGAELKFTCNEIVIKSIIE